MSYSAALLKAEVKALQEAYWSKTRREGKRKSRIMHNGSLTVKEGGNIVQHASIEAQVRQRDEGITTAL